MPTSRRVTRTAALTMGALAVGTATAPAALAIQPVDPIGTTTPESAGTAAPRVLTPAPVLRLGSAEEPVDFGEGKATVSIAPEPGTLYPQDVDLSGATVQVTLTGGSDPFVLSILGGLGATATCTTIADGTCLFPSSADATSPLGMDDEITMFAGFSYTITQLTPPTNKELLLPTEADRTVYATVPGEAGPLEVRAPVADLHRLAPATTDTTADADASITFFDPGAYRSITATVTDAGNEPVEGVTLALCTVPGADCADGTGTVQDTSDAAGLVSFPGSYLPGVYQATVTGAPVGFQVPAGSFPITLGAVTDPADVATPVSLAVPLAAVAPTTTPAPSTAPAPTTSAPAPSTTAAGTAAPTTSAPTTSAPATSAPAPAAATATAAEDELAYTGTDVRPLLAVAGGLVAAGAAALVTVRRRRAS